MAILDTDPTNGWIREACPAAWSIPDEFVTLLISQAGTVGSTAFVDSAKNQTIAPTNASWSNTYQLFGKNTIYCNDGYLRLNTYANFNLLQYQPFCIEFFYMRDPSSSYVPPYGNYSLFGRATTAETISGGEMGLLYVVANGRMYGSGVCLEVTANTYSQVHLPGWKHIAVTRDYGGVVRTFINGSLIGQATNINPVSAFTPLWIGAGGSGGSSGLRGYLAEIRFAKNLPIYTESFTPPSTPWIP